MNTNENCGKTNRPTASAADAQLAGHARITAALERIARIRDEADPADPTWAQAETLLSLALGLERLTHEDDGQALWYGQNDIFPLGARPGAI